MRKRLANRRRRRRSLNEEEDRVKEWVYLPTYLPTYVAQLPDGGGNQGEIAR
jgi:hypothetical protein